MYNFFVKYPKSVKYDILGVIEFKIQELAS